MSYGYPYAPDRNPPPGIPQGYPYGPPPMPSSNPMYPSVTPGFHPPINTMSNSSAYPGSNQPVSCQNYFPPTSDNSPYPASSPYPSNSPSYPSSMPSNTAAPYPTASPYPSNNSSYPSSMPSNTAPYPTASPYPATTTSAYPSASPYPSNNFSPYSANPALNMSYPSSGIPHSSNRMPAGAYPSTSPGSSVTQTSFSRYHHNMAQYYATEGTVKPHPNFDPKQDAEALRKAMKGFGTDEKAIIKVLAERSNSQRVYIAVAFKQLYGKDLVDDLKSELKGNFEDVIVALMTPANDYLASELHNALSGVGTDEDVLIEILCTRTNQEIWAVNEAYQRLYGKNMESDIKSDTSGHFQRLLVSICTGARSEAPADEARAKETAGALFAAGVGQWGTDESVFNSILVAESFQQLALTFYEYQKLAGHTVAEAIDKEMSGDLKKGMLAIARTVENRPFYFAEKLYKAMKGLGTDDRTLIRIVVSRCEVDMVQIKAEYERNYNKRLADAIHGDTSGDYRRVLIHLVKN